MPTPESPWRVAVIDSGLDLRSGITPLVSRRFVDERQQVTACEITGDATGHGTAVAEIIRSGPQGRAPELLIAQVMEDRSGTTPAAVAAAIRWAVEGGAHLIHLSLGLAHDRPVLAAAFDAAVAGGVIVVAATPARGAVSFPARYPGVVRATGDARCAADEISALDSDSLTVGAHGYFTASSGRVLRGSSIGAAYVTRFIVSSMPVNTQLQNVGEGLAALATYRGRENRIGIVHRKG